MTHEIFKIWNDVFVWLKNHNFKNFMNPYFHSQGSDLLNSSPFLSSNLEKTSAEYNTEKEKHAESKSLSERLQNQLEQERVNLQEDIAALRSELEQERVNLSTQKAALDHEISCHNATKRLVYIQFFLICPGVDWKGSPRSRDCGQYRVRQC